MFPDQLLDEVLETKRAYSLERTMLAYAMMQGAGLTVVTRLLDTSVPGKGACNFAFVPEKRLLVVPTWTGNGVVAYFLEGRGVRAP